MNHERRGGSGGFGAAFVVLIFVGAIVKLWVWIAVAFGAAVVFGLLLWAAFYAARRVDARHAELNCGCTSTNPCANQCCQPAWICRERTPYPQDDRRRLRAMAVMPQRVFQSLFTTAVPDPGFATVSGSGRVPADYLSRQAISLLLRARRRF
jgi:hypothetical protein